MAACLVPPEIKEPFAEWVLEILKPLYSADPQILGDYVFALLAKKTEPVAELRQLCLDELQDFLREHTEAFVNLLFAKLKSGFGNPSASSSDRDGDRHSLHASHQTSSTYGSSRRYDEPGPPRERGDYYGRNADRYYDEKSGRGSGGRVYETDRRSGSTGPVDARRDPPRRDRDDFYSSTDRHGDVKRQRSTVYDSRREQPRRERDGYPGSGPSSSPSRSSPSSSRGGEPRERREYRGGNDDRDGRDEGRSAVGGAGERMGERHHERDDRHRTATDPPALTTILVEHIPDHHNNVADLIEQFRSFGSIITATAKPSQQKAFIQFATKSQAEAALSSPSPIFNNRFITISMANRSKHQHLTDTAAAWASSKPIRGSTAGRGAAAAAITRPLPSRDQLKLVKQSSTATTTDGATLEEATEQEELDTTSSSSSSSSSASLPSSSSSAPPIKPLNIAAPADLLQRQLDAQNELLELLKKPGLKQEMRVLLMKQLRSLIESSESGVSALNTQQKQSAPKLVEAASDAADSHPIEDASDEDEVQDEEAVEDEPIATESEHGDRDDAEEETNDDVNNDHRADEEALPGESNPDVELQETLDETQEIEEPDPFTLTS